MTSGPDLIRACPHCGALLRERTLASGNTFYGTLWSDGKEEYPMLPRPPLLVRCPGCAGPYWLADAEQIGTSWGRDDDPPEWKDLPYAESPPVGAYRDALAIGLADTPERERALRLEWWRTSNDKHRGVAGEPPPLGMLLRTSLERLAPLLTDVVLKAEVARSCGAFDKAQQYIAEARTNPDLDPSILEQLLSLAADKSRCIVALDYSD